MSESLYVFLLEDATEDEKHAWDVFKTQQRDEGAQILEVQDLDALETMHQELIKDGWKLTHVGSGLFHRVSLYTHEGIL